MSNKIMKTLTLGGNTYEIYDESARTDIVTLQTETSQLQETMNAKLDADKLSEAINTSLAQAKESGEFDGKDGQDGQDGKTPVKGEDYFTNAEKQAFVTDVLNALPTWTGGSY